ncbi:MAG: OsmC family protein [Terriglobales bacterium]
MKQHTYELEMRWTGNDGQGTSNYRAYRRDHVIHGEGKPDIPGSSDPSFRGDGTRYNPEELLVGALSSCHMLSYLHLCAVNNVVVVAYEDNASGTMEERPDGSGAFTRAFLRPRVTIAGGGDPEKARTLHHEAHEKCFIAKSVNFAVEVLPEIIAADGGRVNVAPSDENA